jgi:hypothetical protein
MRTRYGCDVTRYDVMRYVERIFALCFILLRCALLCIFILSSALLR